MASDRTASRPGWLAAAVPGLLLLIPFVIFVRHHSYPLHAPEILGCVLVLVAVGAIVGLLVRRWPLLAGALTAGALVLLVDLQFDVDIPIEGIGETTALLAAMVVLSALLTWAGTGAVSLVGLMAGAALATTVLLPGDRLVTDESNASGARGDGPLILHLILDEHIGPAGLRAAGRAEAADRLAAVHSRRSGFSCSVPPTASTARPSTLSATRWISPRAPSLKTS